MLDDGFGILESSVREELSNENFLRKVTDVFASYFHGSKVKKVLNEEAVELEHRLYKAGNMSTRLRVLAHSHTDELKDIVVELERLVPEWETNKDIEGQLDVLSAQWYLADVKDDRLALDTFRSDVFTLSKYVK